MFHNVVRENNPSERIVYLGVGGRKGGEEAPASKQSQTSRNPISEVLKFESWYLTELTQNSW